MTLPERAHHRTWLVTALLLGMGLGFTGHRIVDAVPTFVETPLLRTALVDIGTHELMVSRLDTSPGWEHGRHHHAGHELVYVLEGTGALSVEGSPERRLEPGAAAYVPPGTIHAGRNTSRTTPFKFLLIRIHKKGAPLSVELQ
jgi:quercetin dioxygenase-like cupin family protein